MNQIKRVPLAGRLGLRGDLQLVLAREGAVVRRIAVRNTITYNGRNAFLYLLAQTVGVPGDWRLATLGPGTNGTPPTVGDLSLGAPLGPSDQITLTPGNITLSPASGELVITGTLDTTQGNGSTLREAGLILANGQLFARQVHPAVLKDALLTITYTWRIAVTS